MTESEKTFPGLLHPLSFMRRAQGMPSLKFEEIASQELPEPYKQLLAHEGDMTSRLENAFRSSIRVNRIRSSSDGKNYFREVILETSDSPPRAAASRWRMRRSHRLGTRRHRRMRSGGLHRAPTRRAGARRSRGSSSRRAASARRGASTWRRGLLRDAVRDAGPR